MWTGTTWFFVRGADQEVGVPRKRLRTKGPPAEDVLETEVLRKLRTGAGIDREALVNSLSCAGVERTKLAAAQRLCPDIGAYAIIHLAAAAGKDPRAELLRAAARDPKLIEKRKPDGILEHSAKYELISGVLFRRIYNAVENEVQLRCCVPDVPCGRGNIDGQGNKPIGYRERLLLEYHNGRLAGHQER